MAKSKEVLIKEIQAVKADAVVEGLDAKALEAMLKELSTPAAKVYKIAKGKALTVPYKGVLSGGEEIKAEWLPGGDKQLETLIAKGFIK